MYTWRRFADWAEPRTCHQLRGQHRQPPASSSAPSHPPRPARVCASCKRGACLASSTSALPVTSVHVAVPTCGPFMLVVSVQPRQATCFALLRSQAFGRLPGQGQHRQAAVALRHTGVGTHTCVAHTRQHRRLSGERVAGSGGVRTALGDRARPCAIFPTERFRFKG